jgi:hypothetical protein
MSERMTRSVSCRRAAKHGDTYVKNWVKQQWLDMGMATVVFTVHTDRQGRLVANVCVTYLLMFD